LAETGEEVNGEKRVLVFKAVGKGDDEEGYRKKRSGVGTPQLKLWGFFGITTSKNLLI
jgi:hypothetical protein